MPSFEEKSMKAKERLEEKISCLEGIVAECKKISSNLSFGERIIKYIGDFFRFVDDYENVSMWDVKMTLKYYKKLYKKLYD